MIGNDLRNDRRKKTHLHREECGFLEQLLEHDPRFLARVERARKAFQDGQGIRLEDIKWDGDNNIK